MSKSEYEKGYKKGYIDAQLEVMGLEGPNAELEAKAQTAAEDAGHGTAAYDLLDFWLGYYHGRFHGRTGTKAQGSIWIDFTCQRCGHTWTPRNRVRPGVCPACKHRKWDEPKKECGHTTTIQATGPIDPSQIDATKATYYDLRTMEDEAQTER